MKRSKKPADLNLLAKAIVDETTSEEVPKPISQQVAAGRLGGLKGGKARAAKLSKKRRSEIARTAAQTRWAAKKGS